MNGPAAALRFGVPPPHPFEAPGSWLSRLALAQGCPLSEVVEYLGLSTEMTDLDLHMHGVALADLRRRCRLPAEAFGISGRVMGGFHRARLISDDLLTSKTGKPRYRYCPLCVRQRRPPYLEIQWRFADWRYCPDHNCLMEDACWQCGAGLTYPTDMALCPAGRAGHASQARCLSCAADLSAAKACMVDPLTSKAITEVEACWLLNGRALLAALCSGKANYRAEGVGTAAIGHRAHVEWLPRPEIWATTERRLRQKAPGHWPDGAEELSKLPFFFYELTTRWGTVLTLERTKLPVDDGAADSYEVPAPGEDVRNAEPSGPPTF